MTRLIEFLISLALVVALFLIVALVLPSKRHLEESVETNRKMTIVYDTVNNVRRLKDWNSLIPNNPAELKISGGDAGNAGQGAKVDFASDVRPTWKSGSWEITSSEAPVDGGPSKVVYAIQDGTQGTDKAATFTMTPSGKGNRNVRITAVYDVQYGWNLFGRFTGMYLSSQIGDSLKSSLGKLTTNLASIPNFDYRTEGAKLVDLKIAEVPAENVLVVNAGNIERNNDAIKKSIQDNQEWIKRVMEKNNLEAAGPLRIITTDFGAERYAFDVAQPIRKKGGAPKADEAKKDDEKKAEETAAAPDAAAVPAGELKVNVDGTPVTYVHLEPRKAANAHYTGYMAELDAMRNAMRAWALTNGYDVTDRPYDVWNGGVDKMSSDDGSYDLFWQIKDPNAAKQAAAAAGLH
ncbi:MAG: SRPBCC family protein [Pseudoxanthomonas sp.]